MSDTKFSPLLRHARHAQLRRMEMQCDPQWVLDLAAERDALAQRCRELEAQRDAVRSMLDERDMYWLRRFQEFCEDPDAGGHDLPKSAVRDLQLVGALRNVGFGRSEITKFGEYLLAGGAE